MDNEKIINEKTINEQQQKVLDVFIEHFGENNVDSKIIDYDSRFYMEIIVHWDNIKITNEYNISTDIKDFFCKIEVTDNGGLLIEPVFIRTTFTREQYKTGFIHSHLPARISNCPTWTNFCFGRNPITNTIYRLKAIGRVSSFNESDILEWKMFCVELDNSVKVESIEGHPFIRMAEIKKNNYNIILPRFLTFENKYREIRTPSNRVFTSILCSSFKQIFIDFAKYLIEKRVFKFSYNPDRINPCITFSDYPKDLFLKVSACFLEFYNTSKYTESIELFTRYYYISGNETYCEIENICQEYLNNVLVTFKGKEFKLTIDEEEKKYILVLKHEYCEAVLKLIETLINLEYGTKTECCTSENTIYIRS